MQVEKSTAAWDADACTLDTIMRPARAAGPKSGETQREKVEITMYSQESAVRALKRQARHARELAEQLERNAERIEKNGEMEVPLPDLFRWSINDIENFVRNANFASLAIAYAELKADHEHEMTCDGCERYPHKKKGSAV
jgi:hypothetical protein